MMMRFHHRHLMSPSLVSWSYSRRWKLLLAWISAYRSACSTDLHCTQCIFSEKQRVRNSQLHVFIYVPCPSCLLYHMPLQTSVYISSSMSSHEFQDESSAEDIHRMQARIIDIAAQYGCNFNDLDIHGCRDFCETLYAHVYPEHPDFTAWDASDAAELAAMQVIAISNVSCFL